MKEEEINKILFKLSRWCGNILVILMFLYFISGYGSTKAIIDPIFSKKLHEVWLPIPTVICIILHTLFPLKRFLIKRIRDVNWVNIYVLIFCLIILVIVFYLYLL